jgi:hypothetical protein
VLETRLVAQQQAAAAAAQQHQQQLSQLSSSLAFLSPPAYWSCADPLLRSHYAKIEVTHLLKADMQSLMSSTCNAATLGSGRDQQVQMNYTRLEVQRVWRVENMVLWRKYCERREEMRAKRPQRSFDVLTVATNGGWDVVNNAARNPQVSTFVQGYGMDRHVGEMYGWHGTKPGLVDLIAQSGFDERLANTAGLFNAGNYFAEASSKSDQYCTPVPAHDPVNGSYFMFLSRVMIGTPYQCDGFSERIPPLLDANKPDGGRYDSVLGRSNTTAASYREFIVYDKAQCLPEFIVEYKRK